MKSLVRALVLPSMALFALTGCPEDEEPETHGYTCVQVAPGLSEPSAAELFAGTTEIRIGVNYGDCLQDFYLNTATNYAQDGVDGEAIFAEWSDGLLCSEEIAGAFQCEVESIQQVLTMTSNGLQITLKGIDPAGIENRKIPIGPLPLEVLTECPPQVSLGGTGVSGYSSDGAQIWSMETFTVDKANAGLDGRGCMTINAKRN
jgi:hypothetical protein